MPTLTSTVRKASREMLSSCACRMPISAVFIRFPVPPSPRYRPVVSRATESLPRSSGERVANVFCIEALSGAANVNCTFSFSIVSVSETPVTKSMDWGLPSRVTDARMRSSAVMLSWGFCGLPDQVMALPGRMAIWLTCRRGTFMLSSPASMVYFPDRRIPVAGMYWRFSVPPPCSTTSFCLLAPSETSSCAVGAMVRFRFMERLFVTSLAFADEAGGVSASKLTKVTTLSNWLLAVSMASLKM